MSELKVKVIKAGMFTSIQDLGRVGYQQFGVPIGGVMDRKSAKLANQLVGNPENAPVLEITILGPTLEFSSDCQIAITGADISPKLNQEEIFNLQTIDVSKKSVLTFGKLRQGCRAYLAIGGDWQVYRFLGSCCLLSQQNEIFPKGSLLQKEDEIFIQPYEKTPIKKVENPYQNKLSNPLLIRVLPAPEFDWFSKKSIAHFFSQDFQISPDSNRMGYRLKGKKIEWETSNELISSGIILGTVQITAEGQAIILLADAQTTGGYPRIVNVIQENINILAQAKPGDWIRFQLMN